MIYNKPYYLKLSEMYFDGTLDNRQHLQLTRIHRWIAAGKPDLQPGESLPEQEYSGPEIRVADFMRDDQADVVRFEEEAAKMRRRG